MSEDWQDEFLKTAPNRAVADHVASAVARLLAEDRHLFEVKANERSMSHRLAVYLGELFPEWDVDCEYNREGHDPKRLQLNPESIQSDDEEGTTVYPDVIIHRRGGESNLLAIEIKKVGGGSESTDLHKLQRIRAELNYELGIFIRFSVGVGRAGVEQIRWSRD